MVVVFQDDEDDEDSDGDRQPKQFRLPTGCTADQATFFKDGLRKIDFVLVFEESALARAAAMAAGTASVPIASGRRSGKYDLWRFRFMANLRKVGLDMEEVSVRPLLIRPLSLIL
jgi:Dimerisation domain of Ca+-activated chloride-channel, anoctamin